MNILRTFLPTKAVVASFAVVFFSLPGYLLYASTHTPKYSSENREECTGKVQHIFFHSLIIYPEKALADTVNASGYKNNMLTVTEFKQIIKQLYENNFILINPNLLYSFDENGFIHQNKLYLPKGKKPLVISIDDLSYYSYMKNGGFAHKIVIEGGIVKTEVKTPKGDTIITDDGDVIPIVDSFVKEHPDFSLDGAKGLIGATGFEGVLGYRTQLGGERGGAEREKAKAVIDLLKKSGWYFASHSYGHEQSFLKGTVTLDFLKKDTSRWIREVEPLVGKTNVFIGPFGQVFSEKDPRRKMLVESGFTVLYGVGMDDYAKFFKDHVAVDRTNIDGYRLRNNAKKLRELFGVSVNPDF